MKYGFSMRKKTGYTFELRWIYPYCGSAEKKKPFKRSLSRQRAGTLSLEKVEKSFSDPW